ncbi:unnamed protein product [Pleuronectes platessa]|uniref:Uncharacterized protein n=1 Tax=Pleuronectes platessa TaxID=8262 RepID=A0A9N7YK21_PLEPL|nr:unnamed protein product [Pleuronectes platessa]
MGHRDADRRSGSNRESLDTIRTARLLALLEAEQRGVPHRGDRGEERNESAERSPKLRGDQLVERRGHTSLGTGVQKTCKSQAWTDAKTKKGGGERRDRGGRGTATTAEGTPKVTRNNTRRGE